MDHQQHRHGRLNVSPLLVGLLGVMAGAVIVAIVHCIIISWCKDIPNPRATTASLPIRSQRQNAGAPDYTGRGSSSGSGSGSGSFSNVQLVIASNYSGGECKEEICAICLSEFKQGDEVRVLPGCAHTFHVSCVDKWLNSHRNCPLCRAETLPSPRDLVCSLPHLAGVH